MYKERKLYLNQVIKHNCRFKEKLEFEVLLLLRIKINQNKKLAKIKIK
jgi:hypothetical protein